MTRRGGIRYIGVNRSALPRSRACRGSGRGRPLRPGKRHRSVRLFFLFSSGAPAPAATASPQGRGGTIPPSGTLRAFLRRLSERAREKGRRLLGSQEDGGQLGRESSRGREFPIRQKRTGGRGGAARQRRPVHAVSAPGLAYFSLMSRSCSIAVMRWPGEKRDRDGEADAGEEQHRHQHHYPRRCALAAFQSALAVHTPVVQVGHRSIDAKKPPPPRAHGRERRLQLRREGTLNGGRQRVTRQVRGARLSSVLQPGVACRAADPRVRAARFRSRVGDPPAIPRARPTPSIGGAM